MTRYILFDGIPYVTLVQCIRESGLTPMSVPDVMRGQIKAIETQSPEEIRLWLYRHIATTDGIGSYRGKIKVIPGAFNGIQTGKVGSISLPSPKQYKAFGGKEYPIDVTKGLPFSRKQDSKSDIGHLYSGFTKEKAKKHPLLLDLARGDRHLLSDYVEAIHPEAEKLVRKWAEERQEQVRPIQILGIELISLGIFVEQEAKSKRSGPVIGRVDMGTIDNVYHTSKFHIPLLQVEFETSRAVGAIAEDSPQETLEKKVSRAKEGRPFEMDNVLFLPIHADGRLHVMD